ncbi:substrate-binding periplasmic protein [Longimicrobium sp.]|jgi:polar amino acid transport system substrate-binding protein|uniref:substrate-binding periplasmic protein n=1 Tax=Longimicrobium sp. TaxID=2029185 RepID=UPI002ED8C243
MNLKPGLGALLAALACASCGVPRDPGGTLERVRHGTLRVGIIASAPWVVPTGGEPRGVEVRLARDFARELGASVRWVPGTEAELMEALEHSDVDVVIGGLDSRSPWKARAALTRPYHTTRWRVGVRPSAAPPGELTGVRVAVRPGDPATPELRRRGAVPVPAAEPGRAAGPAAGPDWLLPRWGLRETGPVLRERHHVMAVPPGENGFLVRLERFLRERGGEAGRLAREEAP